MYPEGARELEIKLENDFGRAAMHVAYAYLFQQVFTYCSLLQERHLALLPKYGMPYYDRSELFVSKVA